VVGAVSAGMTTAFAIGVHDRSIGVHARSNDSTPDVTNAVFIDAVACVGGAVTGVYWIPIAGCYALGYRLAACPVVHSHVASTKPEVAERTDSSDDGRSE